MQLQSARKLALALPEVAEQPHHELSSFRVRDKIFCTVPPDGEHLHIMLDEDEARAATALFPTTCTELLWGARIAGVRVILAKARPRVVQDLLESAYRRRAPKALVKALDAARADRNAR